MYKNRIKTWTASCGTPVIEIVRHRRWQFACFNMPLKTGVDMACSYNMKLVTSLYYKKIHIFTLLSMLDDKILVFHDDDWCKSYIAFKIDEFSYKCVNNSIYKKFNRISSFTKPHRRLMEWNEWTYKNLSRSFNLYNPI